MVVGESWLTQTVLCPSHVCLGRHLHAPIPTPTHPPTRSLTDPPTHSLTHLHMHKIKHLKGGFVLINMDAYFYKLKIIILVISNVSINGISHVWISLGKVILLCFPFTLSIIFYILILVFKNYHIYAICAGHINPPNSFFPGIFSSFHICEMWLILYKGNHTS